MTITTVNDENRAAVHELAFSHMSADEFEEFKSLSPETYGLINEILRGERGVGLVAEEDSQVVGYLLGGEKLHHVSTTPYAELYEMRVADAYQRRGIGTELVRTFLKWCKDSGYTRISVEVSARSEKNRKFYENLGFVSKTLVMEGRV